MENVKILHIADAHIGAAESFLGLSAEKRRFETVLTFERAVDAAIKKGIKIAAMAGDIFDSNGIDEKLVNAVFSKIEAAKDIKFVFVAGNHDPLNSESPFMKREIPENLFVLGTKDDCITFEDIKVKVYGRSFGGVYLEGEKKFTLKADPDYINIMVQHGELKTDLSSDYNAITKDFIKESGMDYIALGHIHKRSDIGLVGNTYFAYCGCPEGQGFDELDQKGVYIAEIGKGTLRLDFIPTAKRRHIVNKTDISDCTSASQICESIMSDLKSAYGEDYRENLYKIELTGEVSASADIDTAEISSRLADGLYYVKVKDCTEIGRDLDLLAKEISLKGIFAKRMLEKIKNASENEAELYKEALKLGLKAFSREVKYGED